MKPHVPRRTGCLILILLIVGVPGVLLWREWRQERLSAQLLTALKDLYSIAEIDYDPADDKNGSQRQALKQEAVRKEAQVVRLLQEGADPNIRDFGPVKRGFWEEAKFLLKQIFGRHSAADALPPSALAFAVQADDAVVVAALLKAGANDVNAEIATQDGEIRSPLVNYGAYNGNLEIVKDLCAHGADIHKLIQGYAPTGAPILLCTLSGSNRYRSYQHRVMEVSEDLERQHRVEIFHLLLAKGAKYEVNAPEGYALLSAAVEDDLLALTRELLAAGVLPNANPDWPDDPPEITALDYAAMTDDSALVNLLLEHGALTNDDRSEPSILYAQSPGIAKLLLKHGADLQGVRMRGKRSGENALNFACIKGDTEMAAFLIERGLDVNTGGEYASPINEAATYGNVETVRLLLKHGAKVGLKSSGADALTLAIAEQHFESAKLIVRYGAAVNAKDSAPLGEAARQDNVEIVLELLKRGADVNAGKGEALIAACESCDEDLVEVLLEHGANPNVRSDDGKTAMQTAKESADPPSDADGIITLLKKYGAKR